MLGLALALVMSLAQSSGDPGAKPPQASEPVEVEGVTVTGRRTPHPDTVYCVRDLQRATSRIKPLTCERHEVWTIYREMLSEETARNYALMAKGKSYAYSMSTELINAGLLIVARDEAAHRRELRLQASAARPAGSGTR